MVWRKLEQHVDAFNGWIRAHAGDGEGAEETLKAKILGRWPNGDSLVRRPGVHGREWRRAPAHPRDQRLHLPL